MHLLLKAAGTTANYSNPLSFQQPELFPGIPNQSMHADTADM
jgi:hypothetical protein